MKSNVHADKERMGAVTPGTADPTKVNEEGEIHVANDVGDVLSRMVQEALKNVGDAKPGKKSSPLSGAR
ncbi:MAG: hypothetical protein ACXVFK_17150, partial [Solirubrobacteraceae bacterium]